MSVEEKKNTQNETTQEIFGETVARTVELNSLGKELVISFMDFEGDQEIRICPGDIYKIVNALMDYSRLLEIAAQEWDISSYHKAVYEISAEQLRKIADKFSFGIGYNYYEAVEQCRKRLERQRKKGINEDVGEEALTLSMQRRQHKKKEQKAQKEQEKQNQI